MQVASLNDVKIYNLSAGKSIPQWLSERQKRNLAKDENYRRRVELIQDLEFPTASQRIKMSPDGEYIVATGTYPPAVRVYEVQELSMKFERRLTAEVVDFIILSEDVGKIVFLQNDRTIAFHAPYGNHYATRIPTFGRSMAYHAPSCDLYIAASGPDIYRLNLEEGRFRAPVTVRSSEGVNILNINPMHMLLGAGGEDGSVELIDPRSRQALSVLDMSLALQKQVRGQDVSVTSLEFDTDGLTFGVGTSSGHCLLYDLRSSRPLVCKEHQYGLPIISVKFHHTGRKVLSTDSKIVKIWQRDDVEEEDTTTSRGRGSVLTNIETPAAINDVCIVSDKRGDGGLLLLAGEQERVMSYYVPALGPAPRWCSFLDSITEELEEGESSANGGGMTVYDDYKFVTRQELEELNATNLIGTPLLRGYMHGFFMDINLYAKLQAVSQPAAYDEWRKKRLQEKMEAKRASRISLQQRLPQVNRALAERLLHQKKKDEEDAEPSTVSDANNPLGDSRFDSMFTRKDFEVDVESEEFKLRNPNGIAMSKRRRHRRDGSDEDASDDELVVQSTFREVQPGDTDSDSSDEKEVEEDSDLEISYQPDNNNNNNLATSKAAVGKKKMSKKRKQPRFLEAEAPGEDGRVMLLYDAERRQGARVRLQEKHIPLAERVKEIKQKGKLLKGSGGGGGGKRGRLVKLDAAEGGGMVREMTFYPKEQRGGARRATQPKR